MAGGAEQSGTELLAFAQFLDSSPQPLVYGYGRRSLHELRAREFGRLAETNQPEGEQGKTSKPNHNNELSILTMQEPRCSPRASLQASLKISWKMFMVILTARTAAAGSPVTRWSRCATGEQQRCQLVWHLWVDGLPATCPHPTNLLSWFQEDHVQLNGHTCTLITIRVRGQEGGMENIRQHTFTLARYTYAALSALRYPNGAPVVQIYSDSEFSSPEVQGPVISFNMLDDNGNIIGYSQVDKMASLHNIHVRTGCFCNTGACQRHLGISDEMVKKHLQAGHVCGDDVDLIDGQPTGSVRISFGYMSTLEDAQAFLRFIIATRLRPSHGQPLPLATPGEAGALSAESLPATRARRSPSPQEDASPDSRVWDNAPTTADAVSLRPPLLETTRTQQTPSEKAAGILDGSLGSHIVTNLFLYPIKSCAAFEVTRWPLGNQGLLYDRNWMVVNHNGVCLSQKQEPRLCLIQPFIDLQRRIMVIKAQGMEPIAVSLEENSKPAQICQSKVCADRVNTYDCGEKISSWLSTFFGRPYHLIRQSSDFQRNARKKRGKDQSACTTATLSLVNEAQYLLINRSSVLELQQQLSTSKDLLTHCTASCGLLHGDGTTFQGDHGGLSNRCESLGLALMIKACSDHRSLSDENGKEELFPVNNLISRFRANIITSGTRAFEEEKWDEISVGSLHFQVLGPCHRCQMICIDQQTGQRNRNVFQKLSERRERKVNFGLYLMHTSLDLSSPCYLSVGSQVLPVLKENIEHYDLPASEKQQEVIS
nr:molybdenum cofactor sulfurase isoform X13 [Globicephala melas]